MPSDDEHEAKHQDNSQFLTAIGGLPQPNESWSAVVAFYAALHLVERLAARVGVHHRRHAGHGSRQMFLSRNPAHRGILADYMALQSASEIARYEPLGAYQTAYPGGTTQSQLIGGCLQRIRQYVVTTLAAPAAPPATGS